MNKQGMKTSGNMPEFVRKIVVGLKRSPSILALIVLVITFLYYSLNLMHVSDTTAKIQGQGMGLCGFATMLFSMLSLVCFLNSFPRRKKPVIPMIILMFLMFAVIFFCDYHYSELIITALTRAENPITLDKSTIYIAQAYNMLQNHMVLLGVSVAMIVLMPLYGKLLRKIDTSVTVEDYGKMGEIDISGED